MERERWVSHLERRYQQDVVRQFPKGPTYYSSLVRTEMCSCTCSYYYQYSSSSSLGYQHSSLSSSSSSFWWLRPSPRSLLLYPFNCYRSTSFITFNNPPSSTFSLVLSSTFSPGSRCCEVVFFCKTDHIIIIYGFQEAHGLRFVSLSGRAQQVISRIRNLPNGQGSATCHRMWFLRCRQDGLEVGRSFGR